MTHAVMFHHFHGTGDNAEGVAHPRSEGSLSGADFAAMLDYLDREFDVAADFLGRKLGNWDLRRLLEEKFDASLYLEPVYG